MEVERCGGGEVWGGMEVWGRLIIDDMQEVERGVCVSE